VRLRARIAIVAWVALLAASGWIVARAQYSTDLAAFLPRSPSAAQQLLVDQLRDGVVSRLILIGIEGCDEAACAQLSRALRAKLDGDPLFSYANNGAADRLRADGELLIRHRYQLSPAVTPARFTVTGLRAALEGQLDLLASPLGMLAGRMLPRDPTGEFAAILYRLQAQNAPDLRDGVWFSRDGSRALLVAQTRAPGFDLDAQERALARIRGAFAKAQAQAGAGGARLLLSGPAVFGVQSRASIRGDALRITTVAAVCIALLLLAVYRSPRVLLLTLLPVASGALAGVAAVGASFGAVHGVTLGFGATLIGEAVDYAIYLFAGTGPEAPPDRALARIWPTLRLGVLTSVTGFAALLFSGFPGLAQLGLFSASGLIVAVLVTRWVLPALAPASYSLKVADRIGPPLLAAIAQARPLRLPLLAAVALCAGWLVWRGGAAWNDELAALSPVPQAEQRLDEQMRRDLGAPDVSELVIVRAATEQQTLQTAEAVGGALDRLVEAGGLAGFDSPARYLPSEAAQRARLAAIPDVRTLRRNLAAAATGLPFRSGVFAPFLREIEEARHAAPLTRRDLRGTGLEAKLAGLLVERRAEWMGMLPLSGVADPDALARALRGFDPAHVALLDLKRETDALYRGYRTRVLSFSLLGAAAIAALLLVSLRSLRAAWDVLAPLAAALIATCALLAAAGVALNIFHLVAMLLVVGVGSNYTLFFHRSARQDERPARTMVSLLLCNLSTVIGFGLIGLARTPVLAAIGSTVALGAALSLVFGAILTARVPPVARY